MKKYALLTVIEELEVLIRISIQAFYALGFESLESGLRFPFKITI